MSDLNSVSLIGRLTADAKLDFIGGNQTPKLSFSVAVNRRQKQGDQYVDVADFIDVEYWGNGASGIAQYMKKGDQRGIMGSLRQSRWENESGKHSKHFVEARDIQLLGSKNESQSPGGPQPPQGGGPVQAPPSAPSGVPDF